MKFKATKREMREGYHHIIHIHDCQRLLRAIDPIAYSVRVEGWACDYYDVNNVLISTGYSPLKDKNVTPITYEQEKELDARAGAIWADTSLSYGEQREKVKALLSEIVRLALINQE